MIKSICFLTTFRCNAQCDYCECRPWVKDELSLDSMIEFIDESKKLGTVGQVIFSGGEPTLLGSNLLKAINYATEQGMLTRVVTNGWWGGNSVERALKRLDKLIDSGLSELNISIDDLHQEWIPLERAKHAFLACQERNFPVLIAHKEAQNAVITREYLSSFFGTNLIQYEDGTDYTDIENTRLISTGTIIPVGPAKTSISKDNLIYSSNWQRNCGSVLKDIIVGANYQLQPCCGIVTKNIPELTLGDIRENSLIDQLEKANKDAILNWLALEGPSSMINFVKEHDPSIKFPHEFTGICHACNEVLTRPEVRQVILDNIDKKVPYLELHRAFFEESRGQKDIMEKYLD